MKLIIGLDREIDDSWIAEVPELNLRLYGDSRPDAIERAQSAARKIVLDRIAHGELAPDCAACCVRRRSMSFSSSPQKPYRQPTAGENACSTIAGQRFGAMVE